MKVRTVLLVFVATAVSLISGPRQLSAQAAADDAAVRQTIQLYFDGLRNRDVESLKKAFHADAKLYTVDKTGALDEMNQEKWYTRIRPSAQNPDARWEVDANIASLEINGNTAVAKTIVEFPRVQFTDYLSLLKLNGEWKIVNKIYSAKPKPQPKP